MKFRHWALGALISMVGGVSAFAQAPAPAAATPAGAPTPAATPTAETAPLPPRIDAAVIDAALKGLVDSGKLVGVSALVYERGKEAYFGAFGQADRENNKPMARDTIVQIFSMTKPVTGVALMKLFERGKFQLDAGKIGV